MSPSPRSSHREAKKEECRRTIAEAAIQLFEAKGFDATTMDEIAQAAKVSRPTVFNYFAHKTDILAALGQYMVDRLLIKFAEVGPDVPAIQQLRDALVTMALTFAEHPETARAYHVYNMQRMSKDNWRRPPVPQPGMIGILGHLIGLLEQAQAGGAIRADFPAEQLLRHLMIGLFATILGPWLQGAYGDAPLDALVTRHFDLLYHGFQPR